MHSLTQFHFEYPLFSKEWFLNSNYLVLLSVKDENELILLSQKAIDRGIKVSVFREPDINNEVTAITLEPSIESMKLCSSIPLALKNQ